MFNFDFLEKVLGIVHPPHFVYGFQENFISYYTLLTDQLLLPVLLLEKLVNMYTTVVSQPGCDVINFEINLFFRIKPFFNITKNLGQKFKYLENEKSF